jgi:hypothetical protein
VFTEQLSIAVAVALKFLDSVRRVSDTLENTDALALLAVAIRHFALLGILGNLESATEEAVHLIVTETNAGTDGPGNGFSFNLRSGNLAACILLAIIGGLFVYLSFSSGWHSLMFSICLQ